MAPYMNSRKDMLELIKDVTDTSKHSAIIFFWSPVVNSIEERHMWASDYNECVYWLSQVKDRYSELDFKFITYLDGCLDVVRGDLPDTLN